MDNNKTLWTNHTLRTKPIRIVLQSDAEKPYRNKKYISGYNLITSFQKRFKI